MKTTLKLMVLAAVTAAACGGCLTVQVTAKPDLAKKSVEVHLIGITPSELAEWKDYSVTKYFQPSDPKRQAAVNDKYACVMKFVEGSANPQTFVSNTDVWKNWDRRNAKYFVVMADIPGFTDKDDKPGDLDPRRKILPLDASQWEWAYWGAKTIVIDVDAGGLRCITDHKPIRGN